MKHPRLAEFLALATDPGTLECAKLVLADVQRSAAEQGTRMAEAGQPYFASDYIALAVQRGELGEEQGWSLVVRAFARLEKIESES